MKYTLTLFALALATAAQGAIVQPQMGGAQVTMMQAGMKHADIDFDGSSLSIHLDETVPTPVLRPLDEGDSFDPSAPWSVLEGKAYNFQYAWTPASIWAPPSSLAVFVEQISATPGLKAYDRSRASMVDQPTYAPIFENGEPLRWNGMMTHNVYAVANPTLSRYEASYRVYLADELTGVEPTDTMGAPLYGSATTTWTFLATPVPEPTTIALGMIAMTSATLRIGGRRA
ncbi:hypothetical protein [Botrimarina mediterranea]|uniref:hypothetical protein n=1 Tax=Botrimarina mediterranea TaxID=2528022 RepID=UPI0011892BFE|nr:hypothetical protein K2D_41910 [Planctomycetes bacterium K2D]